jgi:16S rRNA (cytosine967-C5)-methyltransferase
VLLTGLVGHGCMKALTVSKNVIDPARRAAYEVLRDVRVRHVYANLQLPHVLSEITDPRQRSFTTDLVYGTLRWQGFLDAVSAQAAHRALSAISPDVLDILRLGAYQILFMSVPSYAAVSSSVRLARSFSQTRYSASFLNAVLRTIAARDRKTWESILTSQISPSQPFHRLALRYSHPDWIVRKLAESWMAARGVTDIRDAIEPVSHILDADNQPADVTCAIHPGLITLQEVTKQIASSFPHASISDGLWSPYALRLKSVRPEGIPALQQGLAGIEDEGSQIAALVCAVAPIDCPDSRWLDLCAGPGGKAALLGSLARLRGARLWANEVNATRARLVAQNMKALTHANPNPLAQISVEDGRGYADRHHAKDQFARVLVDVPCSGLGALRRRPEARWMKTEESITSLTGIQHDLLTSALDCAAPGGVVAYVTCSPVVEETRHIVDSVLEERHDTVRLNATAVAEKLLGLKKSRHFGLPAHGDIQMFADQTHTDMMFVSLLRKL